MPKRPRVTRLQAANLLGVSRTYIRKLTEQGAFRNVQRTEAGYYTYDLHELEMLAIKRARSLSFAGELARSAFKLFHENTPFQDIVIKLGLPPDEVHDLWTWFRYGNEAPRVRAQRIEHEQLQVEHDQKLAELDSQLAQGWKQLLESDPALGDLVAPRSSEHRSKNHDDDGSNPDTHLRTKGKKNR